ncbi:MAG TPA: YceI family protein [Bacteroidia bacterium]|nr:YceI family protein [Bacteroidia bacterium]
MKTIKKNNGVLFALIFIMFASLSLFTQCKKETETITVEVPVHDTVYLDPNDTGVFVPGTAMLDTSWTFEKSHSNVNWQSKYYDFSSTMLTGRFNQFLFTPEFQFDETNLGATVCDFWVQTSTYNTGEPGRDGYGKCGLNYVGIVYLDSSKTQVDHLSDTAKFHCNSITIDTHDGYIMHGTFTFNRWLNAAGHTNGEPITKSIDVNLSFNGMRDFDSNNDGTYDKLRAGFTASFKFNRSDFIDNASTKPFFPVPTAADAVNNVIAQNNKTYGVWSISVGNEMEVWVNAVFYKNH